MKLRKQQTHTRIKYFRGRGYTIRELDGTWSAATWKYKEGAAEALQGITDSHAFVP